MCRSDSCDPSTRARPLDRAYTPLKTPQSHSQHGFVIVRVKLNVPPVLPAQRRVHPPQVLQVLDGWVVQRPPLQRLEIPPRRRWWGAPEPTAAQPTPLLPLQVPQTMRCAGRPARPGNSRRRAYLCLASESSTARESSPAPQGTRPSVLRLQVATPSAYFRVNSVLSKF